MEECGLTVGPKELSRKILELAVTLKTEQMKEMCAVYVTPHYVKRQDVDRSSSASQRTELNGVRPSGKANLSRGDCARLNPEVI